MSFTIDHDVPADTDGARAFLAAYGADQRLTGVAREQVDAWLGPLPARMQRWSLRDEPARRTITVSGFAVGEGATLRWQVEERVDDEHLATVTGPFTGLPYRLRRHRSAWCGHVTDVILWTDARGRGPGADLTRGLSQEEVAEIARRADRVAAADGTLHARADGAVEELETRPPLSRGEYETLSAALGVEPLADDGPHGVDSYGMRHGDFGLRSDAEAARAAQQRLAWRRRAGIEAERAAKAAAEPPAPPPPEPAARPWGAGGVRYDERCERCERCGRVGEVDNDTGLCARHGGGAR